MCSLKGGAMAPMAQPPRYVPACIVAFIFLLWAKISAHLAVQLILQYVLMCF